METVSDKQVAVFIDELKAVYRLPYFLTKEVRDKIFMDLMEAWKKREPLIEESGQPPATPFVSNMVSNIVQANVHPSEPSSFNKHFAEEALKTKARVSQQLIPEYKFWAKEGWIFPHRNRNLLEKLDIPNSYFWSAWGIVNFILLALIAALGKNHFLDFSFILILGSVTFILNMIVFVGLLYNIKRLRKKQAQELADNARFIDENIKIYRNMLQNLAQAPV